MSETVNKIRETVQRGVRTVGTMPDSASGIFRRARVPLSAANTVRQTVSGVRNALFTGAPAPTEVVVQHGIHDELAELAQRYAESYVHAQQVASLEEIARRFGEIVVHRGLTGQRLALSGAMPVPDEDGTPVMTWVLVLIDVDDTGHVNVQAVENYFHDCFHVGQVA